MFRQYTPLQGRWMGPDPYMGSYDQTNPQSFNRYGYAMNNPIALTDPQGLDGGDQNSGGGGVGNACLGAAESLAWNFPADAGCAWGLFQDISGLFGSGPSFHGTLSPRPSTGSSGWDGNFGESLGIPTSIPQGSLSLGAALGLPSQGCEFGPCDGGGFSFQQPGQADQNDNGPQYPYLPPWLAQNRNKQGRPPGRPTEPNIPRPGPEPVDPELQPLGTMARLVKILGDALGGVLGNLDINSGSPVFMVNVCRYDPMAPICIKGPQPNP